ncbi:hypothetical protein M5K25_020332 [Dendrobium thyrsiflorum]|uniref:Uncharacterized protein n=1 Tax=Dendrobium thyrsiflorum TaxID=117978 RepID=A0ABD0U9S9_DENTH
MAIARTGVFVDDYLECKDYFLLVRNSSTLAAELRRLLSTMRELDERAQGSTFAVLCYNLQKNETSPIKFSGPNVKSGDFRGRRNRLRYLRDFLQLFGLLEWRNRGQGRSWIN